MADGLLDTTFFIDALRGEPGARRLVDEIVSGDFVAYYSPVTLVELSSSPYYTPSEDAFFHGLISVMEEVPFTTRAAQLAGLYLRDMPPMRAERLFRDAMIGATGTTNGLAVYTKNVRDMTWFAATVRRY